MRALNQKEFDLLKVLLQLNEESLEELVTEYLQEKYHYVFTEQGHYVMALGSIPVVLVAHLDTVCYSPKKIYYDKEENVIFSGCGLGADDRAGVWIIFQLLNAGFRPSVLFTLGEEDGCIGAMEFANAFSGLPSIATSFGIEFDRQGKDDCVFYDCDNPEFTSFIESYGFKKAIGSYSDISAIAPMWGIAFVNVSVGYENEHTRHEILHTDWMLETLEKVKQILLNERSLKKFDYIPCKKSVSPFEVKTCDKCGDKYVTYRGAVGSTCENCCGTFYEENLYEFPTEIGNGGKNCKNERGYY